MRLIDAEIVLNKYQEICNGVACMDCPFNKDGCAFEKLILESAVVDAEPIRHGKWEHGREISRGYIGDACIGVQYEDWKCSNCGIVCEQSDKPKYKYCPSCGCKMDLDEVNDEVKDT